MSSARSGVHRFELYLNSALADLLARLGVLCFYCTQRLPARSHDGCGVSLLILARAARTWLRCRVQILQVKLASIGKAWCCVHIPGIPWSLHFGGAAFMELSLAIQRSESVWSVKNDNSPNIACD